MNMDIVPHTPSLSYSAAVLDTESCSKCGCVVFKEELPLQINQGQPQEHGTASVTSEHTVTDTHTHTVSEIRDGTHNSRILQAQNDPECRDHTLLQ